MSIRHGDLEGHEWKIEQHKIYSRPKQQRNLFVCFFFNSVPPFFIVNFKLCNKSTCKLCNMMESLVSFHSLKIILSSVLLEFLAP